MWRKDLPAKISFVIWLLVRDRVLTHSNLQKRGFSWVSMCFFCAQAEEDKEHLFVQCPLIDKVWRFFSTRSDQNFLLGASCDDRVRNWNPTSVTKQGRQLRSPVPYAILGLIWKERNGRCFEEKSQSLQQLIKGVMSCVWGWTMESQAMTELRLDKVLDEWVHL